MPGWLGLTFDFLGNLTLSSSLTALFLFLACYYVAPHHILKRRRATRSSCKTPDRGNTSRQGFTKTTDTDAIEPLHDFDIRVARPIQYRPYNTQGHVTMGIQKRLRQDWIRIDFGYLDRIAERRALIERIPEYTIGAGPLVNPAIEELYSEILLDYLPRRYPTIFCQHDKAIHNKLTGESYPLSLQGLSPERMLELLGVNVEEDFYFMCPDPSDGEFRLRGYIACFPGGFFSPERLGQSVREIHQPVPGYEERLGNSVDKYFKRMMPGQFIGRMNWSLQVDGEDLFRKDGNNFYPDTGQSVHMSKRDPDLNQCFLRVEHQTLTCLKRSRAIIFCVRSYMTALKDIKTEGEGPALAAAIRSMPEKLGDYKMRPFWEDTILPWLDG